MFNPPKIDKPTHLEGTQTHLRSHYAAEQIRKDVLKRQKERLFIEIAVGH